MTCAPTHAAIYAAELKVAQHRLQARAALHRGGIAFRAGITKPSTILKAAAVVAIVGFGLTRQPRSPARPSSRRTGVARLGSAAAYVVPFILRYVKMQLPAVLSGAWAARHDRGEHANADVADLPHAAESVDNKVSTI
ncbi:hypothetical protein AAKU67_004153 [Oxalobacteraceae bacterium GrIS 2.11]